MAQVKAFLSLADIGKLLGLDAAGVRRLLATEDLPVTRVGGRAVVTIEAWRAWVLRVNERALASLAGRR